MRWIFVGLCRRRAAPCRDTERRQSCRAPMVLVVLRRRPSGNVTADCSTSSKGPDGAAKDLGRRIQMQASAAEGSGDFGQELAAEPVAEFLGLPRTAARYWLLQFEDGELRFTHRAG